MIFKGRFIHKAFVAILILSITFFLNNCGGGDENGAPGSKGLEEIDVDIRILSITNSDPNGDIGDIWEVDIIQDNCEPDPNKPPDFESFGDNFANITFQGIHLDASQVNNVFYITYYKATFTRLDPTFPTIDEIQAGVQGNVKISPNNQTGPFPFLIFDVGRKVKLHNDITSGLFIPSSIPLLYDMTIEMWGEDQYGQSFKDSVITRQIELANYDYCD
jgi:hypothetical protein